MRTGQHHRPETLLAGMDTARLSHNLCKPAERCRIEAADRRLLHMARKNRTPEENARREKI